MLGRRQKQRWSISALCEVTLSALSHKLYQWSSFKVSFKNTSWQAILAQPQSITNKVMEPSKPLQTTLSSTFAKVSRGKKAKTSFTHWPELSADKPPSPPPPPPSWRTLIGRDQRRSSRRLRTRRKNIHHVCMLSCTGMKKQNNIFFSNFSPLSPCDKINAADRN